MALSGFRATRLTEKKEFLVLSSSFLFSFMKSIIFELCFPYRMLEPIINLSKSAIFPSKSSMENNSTELPFSTKTSLIRLQIFKVCPSTVEYRIPIFESILVKNLGWVNFLACSRKDDLLLMIPNLKSLF